MIAFLTAYRRDEDGAVTVDWVVLTAAIVGLGLASVSLIRGGIMSASIDLAGTLGNLQSVFAW